jgi:hypothetical protein
MISDKTWTGAKWVCCHFNHCIRLGKGAEWVCCHIDGDLGTFVVGASSVTDYRAAQRRNVVTVKFRDRVVCWQMSTTCIDAAAADSTAG